MNGYRSILTSGLLVMGLSSGGMTAASAGEGDSLPPVCSLFPQDLGQKLSTKPLKKGGKEKVVGELRFCNYERADGALALLFASVSKSRGSPEDYKKGCLHPPYGGPGKVIGGVGTWACFIAGSKPGDTQVFNAGNSKWDVGLSGDAPLDSLKQAALGLLQKLPK
jgi:hypothetical protein